VKDKLLAYLWGAAFGVIFTALAVGLLALTAARPVGKPVSLIPAPTSAPITIYVSGAVRNPGIFSLAVGSRVMDALEASGGMLPEAAEGSLNLAARLEDGQQIDVPEKSKPGEPAPLNASNPNDQAHAPTGEPPSPTRPVNINTADEAELDSLPGIGPATAEKILTYRQEHGPFEKVEDLMLVPGIGQVTFDKLKELITVGIGG
jgi:competence protein ComEA